MSDGQNATDDFLTAERAAEQLAESLRKLDAERAHYTTATKTLDQVGAGIRGLADRTAEVASRTSEAVEAIRSVGSAQILEQVQGVSQSVSSSLEAVGGVEARLGELVGQGGGIAGEVTDLKASSNELRSRVDELMKSIEAATARSSEGVESLTAANTELRSRVDGLAAVATELGSKIDGVASSLLMIRNIAIAAAALAGIAAVLTRF